MEQRPVFAANTALFFEEHGRKKRRARTPVASAATTPQEETACATAASSASRATTGPGMVVTTPHFDDHTAYQITAGHLGTDVNSPQQVEAFLQQPVATTKDVLRLIKGYHEAIIRPELYGAVVQLEHAMKSINDKVWATQSELRFMASDNRSQQKHQSGLMLITTGWPTGMTPAGQCYMLGWMIQQSVEAKNFLRNRGLLRDDMDHAALDPQFWFGVLSVDPTTVPQGKDFYSTMTMLTFKSWDLRSAFLNRYGGTGGTPLYADPTTPQAGRHIRVSPCAPQWQAQTRVPAASAYSCLQCPRGV